MKFVCDNCKAKYQIGDDKVAGKTLRMKCRRCGHLIQVAASVTESSVSTKLPVDSATGSYAAATAADLVTGSTSALFPAPSAPPARPSAPSRPLEDHDSSPEEGATMVRPSPLFLFQDQKPATTPPPAGGPPRPPPATPSALGSVPPRPATSNPGFGPRLVPPARASMRQSSIPPPNHSATGAVPRAPLRSAPGAAVALAQPLGDPQARITPEPMAPPQHQVSSPGLYGGFAQAVKDSRDAGPISTSQLPTEDWYVGIAGVPLGPVRLSVLREKASQNQVSADSLVWREGYDEWLPVKKVPGLLEIVEEAKLQRNSRNSGLTPVPGPAPAAPRPPMQSSATVLMPDPAPSHPFDLVPSTPPPNASSPAAASPTQASGPSSDLFGSSAKVDVVKDPFASTGAVPAAAAPAASGFGLSTSAAFGGDKPAADIERPSVAHESIPPKKKKGMHPMVWAFIAMAAAFGGVAAWALFLRNPNVVYLPGAGGTAENNNGPAPPAPPTTSKSTDDSSSPDATNTTAEATTSSSTGPVAQYTGKLPPNSSAAKSSGSSTFDPSGFGPTPPGPKTVPTDDTSTGGGGGPLTEGQASGVVSRNSPRVRRTCWDPQVSARSADAPSSVKVTATVNVAPNGSVSSVSTSGGNEKHYPGLASCVASNVKGWSFPPSGEGGKIVVPFSFNAQ